MLKGKNTYLFDGWCGFPSPAVLLRLDGSCGGSGGGERLGRFVRCLGKLEVAGGVRTWV